MCGLSNRFQRAGAKLARLAAKKEVLCSPLLELGALPTKKAGFNRVVAQAQTPSLNMTLRSGTEGNNVSKEMDMKKTILILGAALALVGCNPNTNTGGSDQTGGGSTTNAPSTSSQGGANTPGGSSTEKDVNKDANNPAPANINTNLNTNTNAPQ
jgi:hypothetical protein